jgi:hypothetical protein
MANPVVFRSSKVFAFIQVAQINDTGAITSNTAATAMTVDAGHRLKVGMDVLIENECVKVTAIDTSSHEITINRAEVTHTSATTTTAATHANDTPIFAWSELVDSNDTPLMQSFSIIDELYKPRMVNMTLANPFSGAINTAGILEGIIKQSVPIKIEEGENHSILFTGKISSVTRQQSGGEGNTMKITAYDNLFELARTKIGGDSATINVEDASGSNADLGSTKTAAAAIKFLIKKFQFGGSGSTTDGEETNTTTTEPVSGSENRFQESLDSFMNTTRNSKISFGSSDITTLYAIKRLASGERIARGKFGYIFYNDPNITSFSTASNPAQMFNYYPAGFMPSFDQSSVADGSRTAASGFLNIHNYGTTNSNNNGFVRRMKPGAAFDLIKGETLTEIRARFRDPNTAKMTETTFELFHWKSQSISSSHAATRYGGKSILAPRFDTTGLFGVEDPDRTSVADRANHSARVVDSSNNIIGYVQFQPETASSKSNGDGIMILSNSEIAKAGVGVSAGQQLFFDNASSGDSITLCDNDDIESEFPFRAQAVGQERQIARMDFGTSVNANDIRAAVASRFAQKGRQKIRGRFQIDGKYPFQSMDTQITGDDSITTSSAGEKTKVVFVDNSMDGGSATTTQTLFDGVGSGTSSYEGFGLRAGHTINKLTAEDGTSSDTYGYLEKVTPKELTFLITSGSISTNDFIRVNVPLRAGHNIVVQSFPHKIGTAGTNVAGSAMVTAIEYTETGSRAYTHIETIAHNSQETQDIVAETKPDIGDLDEQTDDDFGGLPYGFEAGPHFTGKFAAGDTGGNDTDKAISYTSGTLYIGGENFAIAADDSDNGSVGLGTTLNVTDTDADGEPNTRAVVYFEPARSKTKFIIEAEDTFEQRNAAEGRIAAGNLRVPIGINRVLLGYAYGSPSGDTAIFTPVNDFTFARANQSDTGGTNADTGPKIQPQISPNQYGPVINGNWIPAINDQYDLGKSAGGVNRRWDDVHATNGTIQTSDIRDKEEIQPMQLGLEFIKDLNPVTYKWKKKKEHKLDQVHYGIIAQETLEALKKYGIDSNEDFGGITGNDEDHYGARYTEFVAILIKAVQELSDEIDKLKNEGEE